MSARDSGAGDCFGAVRAVCLPGWAKSALPACSQFLRKLPQSCLTPFPLSPATLPFLHQLPALGRARWPAWHPAKLLSLGTGGLCPSAGVTVHAGCQPGLVMLRHRGKQGCAGSSVPAPWHLGKAGSDVPSPPFHPLHPRASTGTVPHPPSSCAPTPKRRSLQGSPTPDLHSSH